MDLVNQITTKPNVNEARQGLGEIYISMNTSCKPYPYGFISFASIALLKQLSISEMFDSIEVEVSSCVYELGCKRNLIINMMQLYHYLIYYHVSLLFLIMPTVL